MTPKDAILTCLRKSFRFSGRASRSEFWWFVVAGAALSWIAAMADTLFWPDTFWAASVNVIENGAAATFGVAFSPLSTLVGTLLALPTLSAAWRRMHDVGRHGALNLMPLASVLFGLLVLAVGVLLVPNAGAILPLTIAGVSLFSATVLTLLWLCTKSITGPNRYGPNPLEVTQ